MILKSSNRLFVSFSRFFSGMMRCNHNNYSNLDFIPFCYHLLDTILFSCIFLALHSFSSCCFFFRKQRFFSICNSIAKKTSYEYNSPKDMQAQWNLVYYFRVKEIDFRLYYFIFNILSLNCLAYRQWLIYQTTRGFICCSSSFFFFFFLARVYVSHNLCVCVLPQPDSILVIISFKRKFCMNAHLVQNATFCN